LTFVLVLYLIKKIMRRKLILPPLFFFLAIICVFLLSGILKAAKAEEPQIPSPLDTLKENISDEDPNLWQWMYGKVEKRSGTSMQAGEGWVAGETTEAVNETGVIPAIEHALLGQIIGIPDENNQLQGGAIDAVSNGIAAIYASPPASGIYYARNILHNLGAIPAYAADGIGFNSLKPILPIWKAFRNMAYSLFTIAFLIIGLMIMFRIKISPQAILTIENALPRMIGVLVLITFSYAIVGFLIDLMYVLMALMMLAAKQGGLIDNLAETQRYYATAGTGAIAGPLIGGSWHAIDDLIRILYHGGMGVAAAAIGGVVGAVLGSFLIPGLGTLAGGIVGGLTGTVGGGVAISVIATLILSVVGLILLFKLWFNLIKTYISILVQLIFSPLIILASVFPQEGIGFGAWLKGLAANLLVFPVVAILILIAMSLMGENATNLWTPPFLSGTGLSYGATGIVGIGFLLILPSVPDIIRNAMGIKDSGIGAMIGQSLAPVKMVGGLGVTGGKQFIGSRFLETANEGGIKEFLKDYAINQKWYISREQKPGSETRRA